MEKNIPSTKKKDMANATEIYPVIITNPLFRNLHNELLYNLAKHFEKIKRERNLVILGVSPIASPYGDNKNWVFSLFKNKGKIICLDYNLKVIGRCYQYLHQKRFFNDHAFSLKIILESKQRIKYLFKNGFKEYLKKNHIPINDLIKINKNTLNLNSFKDPSFIFIEKDLRDKINLPTNSVHCIDATLTLHHLGTYREQLKKVLKEIYRILKPGGLFHYGDGFINTRRTEQKINELMNYLAKSSKQDLLLIDKRDKDKIITACYKYGKFYENVPLYQQYSKKGIKKIIISNKGKIIIPVFVRNLSAQLKNKGFKQMLRKKNYLELPLIDSDMKADQVLIKEVNEFYNLNRELKANLKGFPQSQIQLAVKKGDEERINALKGLVEYFCPVDFIISLLKEVGFVKIKIEKPNKKLGYKPFIGAILAYKPLN